MKTNKRHIAKNIIVFLTLLTVQPAIGESPSKQSLSGLADEASKLFQQANELVQKAQQADRAKELYTQAILRYQKIIEEGKISNGPLYYNIGNACLLKGDIGRAILNYRRAELLDTGDTDLAGSVSKNLEYARSKRLDQVPIKTKKRVLQTLFFWHYDFSTKTKFLIAGICWTLAWITASIRIWRRKGSLLVMILPLVVAISLAGSVALDVHHSRTYSQGVIVAERVIARQGDGGNYPASFTEPLHSGTEFDLREQRSQWLRIELSSGDQGWIPADSAEIINPF